MSQLVDAITVKFGIFFGDCFGRNAAGFFLKKTKRNRDYFVNPAIYHKGVLKGFRSSLGGGVSLCLFLYWYNPELSSRFAPDFLTHHADGPWDFLGFFGKKNRKNTEKTIPYFTVIAVHHWKTAATRILVDLDGFRGKFGKE